LYNQEAVVIKIDYSSFESAIGQLEKSLSFLNSELARSNLDLRDQFRSASVQAYEYTYELCIKMLRRQLGEISANPGELKEMPFMDFIRMAFEAGLVEKPVAFKLYREMRNTTSHAYGSDKAEKIIQVTTPFLKEMKFVLAQLIKRNT
jgi:nucleotidyltransferase substrate binding protein (TIGR01987 family)